MERNDDDLIDDVDVDDATDLDEDFDDLDDATEEDVDFALALYREEGTPIVAELATEVANDLDELIAELRRFPGDAGTLGVISIAGDFFVLVRVRGRSVQVLLNDGLAADEWPIARDVVDFLDEDEVEDEPVGDLDMLADLGCPEMVLDAIATDYDTPSDELALAVMDKLKFGAAARKVIG